MCKSHICGWPLLLLLLLTGCAKNYVVTQPLIASLAPRSTCVIGEIRDELPAGTEVQKKPTQQTVETLRRLLGEELARREIFAIAPAAADGVLYEVRGSFLEFRKGSGVARFFIGWGVGNAKATVRLALMDRTTEKEVFSGNFTSTVTSGMESGSENIQRIAKNFAKALSKEIERRSSPQ